MLLDKLKINTERPAMTPTIITDEIRPVTDFSLKEFILFGFSPKSSEVLA